MPRHVRLLPYQKTGYQPDPSISLQSLRPWMTIHGFYPADDRLLRTNANKPVLLSSAPLFLDQPLEIDQDE